MSFVGPKALFFHHLVFVSVSLALFCSAKDTLSPLSSIADGDSPETLVSSDETFELGFFSPTNSSRRYVGVWYKNIADPTVVWVANRENPISNRTGILTIDSDGNLVILVGNVPIWTSNVTTSYSNSSAGLEADGNLILFQGVDRERPYWESFQNPTDTFLAGMRVEVNTEKGENRAFRSWRSRSDPSPGNFTMGVDPRGSPQIVVWNGDKRHWRSGHWNLQIFIGIPNMTATVLYGFKLSTEGTSRYISYDPPVGSDKIRFRIEWNGVEEQLRWEEETKRWEVTQSQPEKECDEYNKCGNYGVCSQVGVLGQCGCMAGFEQRRLGDWSGGCRRRTLLKCERNASDAGVGEDGFDAEKGVKVPDFADVVVVGSGGSCKEECLRSCSCRAYAEVNGIGCMVWKGDLIDVRRFEEGGQTLYIRLAHSDLATTGRSRKFVVLVVVLSVVGAILLCVFVWFLWRYKLKLKVSPTSSLYKISWLRSGEIPVSSEVGKSKEYSTELSGPVDGYIDGSQPELPLFSFNFVATSTNNFSEENKLGEGGFGPVYKGRLPGGQEIAVKRLSRKSGQGLEEFKNEIILIAKLQHRNLVRLLGCSIQGEEKMLLYEYMPNKSLDFVLFDQEKQALLDWKKRFNIIEGIARGILYLHRDSRLRIIHRDLKASNILLDEEMNPKISDFGMARMFGGNQIELNTNRVVGTYGYMSPEYAMEGLFSVKSDVYSFGVLLLEIVSGRRNTSFRNTEHVSLIGYAWHLWNEGRGIELLDPSIAGTSSQNEVLRCIQVGVLCVQDSPLYRPTMSSVVLMLESENATMPLPRQPTFTSMRGQALDIELFSEGQDASVNASGNDMTVTMVDGR